MPKRLNTVTDRTTSVDKRLKSQHTGRWRSMDHGNVSGWGESAMQLTPIARFAISALPDPYVVDL